MMDAKAASAMTDIPPETLIKTPPGELRFWHRETGREPEYIQFKYMG